MNLDMALTLQEAGYHGDMASPGFFTQEAITAARLVDCHPSLPEEGNIPLESSCRDA